MSEPGRYSCEEVFRQLDDYVDRELGSDEISRVQGHLEDCVACAMKYDFEESFIREVRKKIARIEAPPDLMERISVALGSVGRDEDGS